MLTKHIIGDFLRTLRTKLEVKKSDKLIEIADYVFRISRTIVKIQSDRRKNIALLSRL
jgi:hypothetical protein